MDGRLKLEHDPRLPVNTMRIYYMKGEMFSPTALEWLDERYDLRKYHPGGRLDDYYEGSLEHVLEDIVSYYLEDEPPFVCPLRDTCEGGKELGTALAGYVNSKKLFKCWFMDNGRFLFHDVSLTSHIIA